MSTYSPYPRQEYEISQQDLDELLAAMRPQPVMKIGNHWSGDTQNSANAAWQALGKKMGFVWDSVRPVEGKGRRFISAIPSENETQRAEREEREKEERRKAELEEVDRQLARLSQRRRELVAAKP